MGDWWENVHLTQMKIYSPRSLRNLITKRDDDCKDLLNAFTRMCVCVCSAERTKRIPKDYTYINAITPLQIRIELRLDEFKNTLQLLYSLFYSKPNLIRFCKWRWSVSAGSLSLTMPVHQKHTSITVTLFPTQRLSESFVFWDAFRLEILLNFGKPGVNFSA